MPLSYKGNIGMRGLLLYYGEMMLIIIGFLVAMFNSVSLIDDVMDSLDDKKKQTHLVSLLILILSVASVGILGTGFYLIYFKV